MEEGRSDDFEMQDLGENYTDYDNMSFDKLNQKYDLLNQSESIIFSEFSNYNYSNKSQLADIQNRRRYIVSIRTRILNQTDTSFTDSDDGKTVIINNKGSDTQVKAPRAKFENPENYGDVEKQNFDLAFKEQADMGARLKNLQEFNRKIAENQIKRIEIINKKIRQTQKKSLGNDITSKEIIDRSFVNDNRSLFLKEKGKKGYMEPKLIIKGDGYYGKGKRNSTAIKQFQDLVKQLPVVTSKQKTTQQATRNDIEKDYDDFPLVKISTRYTDVDGLTNNENKEVEGVLNPENSIDPKSRIGDNGALQIQADHFQEALNKTIEQRDQTENPEDYIDLEERIVGLRQARAKTLEQRQLEETREPQEEGINRLQKFKDWAKENLVGLSALAISVSGIITTIIVGARKALIKGAQATGKFAKVVYKLGKKLGALLAPILNVIAQALSWGAKGLAWLANNLWLLALAVAWFIYDQYKQRRRRK